MKFVIYTSLAVARGEATPDLSAILRSCLQNNPRWTVTGWLHFELGRFYQVVEGPDAAVTLLMARIRDDRRHYGLAELSGGEISARQFPDFDMGFGSADGCYLRPTNSVLLPPGAQEVMEFLMAMSRRRLTSPALSTPAVTRLIRH